MINQFVCKHNRKILSTYPAFFIHESQSGLQKLKIWFWPHLQRRKHQLEQEEICPQTQNNLIAELRTDLWSLSPKSNNTCHALCFTQDSLNLAKALTAEMLKWFIFLLPKKSKWRSDSYFTTHWPPKAVMPRSKPSLGWSCWELWKRKKKSHTGSVNKCESGAEGGKSMIYHVQMILHLEL